jgi:hypothetical protein
MADVTISIAEGIARAGEAGEGEKGGRADATCIVLAGAGASNGGGEEGGSKGEGLRRPPGDGAEIWAIISGGGAMAGRSDGGWAPASSDDGDEDSAAGASATASVGASQGGAEAPPLFLSPVLLSSPST